MKLNPFLRNIFKTYGEPASHKYNNPVFVTGCMRSGTTLLVDKLVSHPQLLKIGVELNDVWTNIGGANIVGRCDFRSKTDANSKYTYQMTNYISDFINDSKSLKRHLMRASVKIRNKTGRVFYDWDEIIPVNKSPHLMNKLEYINDLFPESKFIVIIRDIFAHTASMKVHFDRLYNNDGLIYYYPENNKSCWSSNKIGSHNFEKENSYPTNFELIPKMWFRLNNLAINSAKNINNENILFISYENLFLNQDKTLKKVFNFLDLNKKHNSKIDTISSLKANIINSSTKGNPLEKWKNQLSEEEIKSIDNVINKNKNDYSIIKESVV